MQLSRSCRLLGAVGALLVASACSDPLGAPSKQPLPSPDPYPVLLERGPLSPRIANYRIDVSLDPGKHFLRAQSTLRWTNTSQRSLQVLPFHLYMNAFKNEASVFMRESRGRHRRAKATHDGWGWIDVTSVRIAGAELIDTVRYPHDTGDPQTADETVMEVPLATPLAPGADIAIEMAFEVQLPEVFARTGYKGAFHMVGQWFPKIGVLVGNPGQERWHCEPFHLNSEFFADFGVYDVSITAPDTHVIVGTGIMTGASDADGLRTHTYHAEDVHDFVWMADPYMRMMSAQATTDNGPVEVRVYHRPRQRGFARRHLEAGVGAIEQFSRLYRTYPWPIMSIIDPPLDAASSAGGMEYPTVVTTAGDSVLLRPGMRLGEFVTVHEIGHNWFQGMLASNEVDEAWLDEGVNEYADWVVMNELYGEGKNLLDWHGLRADNLELAVATGRPSGVPVPIDTLSYAFPDNRAYGAASYSKTAVSLRSLEASVGREAFRAAMRIYAQRYAFRHPTGDDFFDTLEESLGRDARRYLESAFRSVGAAEFAVRDISCRKTHAARGVFGRGESKKTVTRDDAPDTGTWSCEIILVNLGRVQIGVDVALEFADGERRVERWEPIEGKAWHKLVVEHSSRIERVTIDPERQVLINEIMSASDVRETPERAASRRAAARVGFWTQTAMQVTGL